MMKELKTDKYILLVVLIAAVAFLLSAVLLAPTEKVAYAGASRVEIATDASFDEEISIGKWNVSGKVRHGIDGTTGKGVIEFDPTSSATTRIVSIVRADAMTGYGELNDCINGSISLTVSELKGEFYIVFGLGFSFSAVGQGNCSAIAFYEKDGDIAVKVINIQGKDANGDLNKTTIKESDATFSYDERITVDFNAKTIDGESGANGRQYLNYDNDILCYAEGYFGFAQSAGSGVIITSANVYSATYDSPVTINVDEDFEGGEFDAARLFTNNNDSSAAGFYTPEGVSCEDGVLKFNNITQFGFVSTCSKFSNFEMTFDMPHLQREFVYDADGKVLLCASNFFGISIGAPLINNSHFAITQAVFLYFHVSGYVDGKPTGLSCALFDNYQLRTSKRFADDADNNFWSVKNAYDSYGREKAVNMKITMTDGSLVCSFKWAGENSSK